MKWLKDAYLLLCLFCAVLLCKQTPEPKKEQLLSMCVMGVCL
jgi:hypothetical protein